MNDRQQVLFEELKAPQERGGWLRFLYNNNPFYVISVCLVLYGIHVSFGGGAELAEGWLLLQLLGGYTVLLMLSAILIVRVGAVWEDARTIVLLVLVLLVALSASFDKVCLDSVAVGRRIQLFGFSFALAVFEFMLRGVNARLSWRYRLPLYALFALLFFYPTWLGELSINGEEPRMAWYVFLFPAFAGLGILSLLPAARNAGRGEWPNGTPWRWPLYPWCGLAFLAVALIVRSYGLSVSFELADGFQSAFQWFYLIPLLLAVMWVLTELAYSSDAKELTPLLGFGCGWLLLLAFPGASMNATQASFWEAMTQSIGSPVQWASVLVLGYYVYFWLRGVHSAEWGVYFCVLLFACGGRETMTINTLQAPQFVPGALLAAFLLLRSRHCRSASRFLFGCSLLVGSIILRWQDHFASPAILMLTIVVIAWMTAGLLFDDALGRFIRSTVHWFAWLSGGALMGFAFVYGIENYAFEVPVALAGLTMALFTYWCDERSARRLAHVLVSFVATIAHGSVLGYLVFIEQLLQIDGRDWLVYGLLSLAAGVVLSLVKAGRLGASSLLLLRLNRRLVAWLP